MARRQGAIKAPTDYATIRGRLGWAFGFLLLTPRWEWRLDAPTSPNSRPAAEISVERNGLAKAASLSHR